MMLRETLGSFSIKRLILESGVDPHVSDNIIIRILKRNKYQYLQSWKKGLMSRRDARTRLLFARNVKRILSRDIWTSGIGLYFDGASWTHKTNPCDQAKSTTAMAWRKKTESLALKCTTNGKKEGSGGKMVKLFVAIACGHGAVLCEQYEEQLTGQFFSDFHQNTLKMLLKITATHEGNYSCKMETPVRILWKRRMLECYIWHWYSNVFNSAQKPRN